MLIRSVVTGSFLLVLAKAALVPDNNIQEGDYIHLQVSSAPCNKYLAPFLIVTGDQVLTSEVEDRAFKVTSLKLSNRIQLKSEANGYWLAANNWGNSRVIASKTAAGDPGWETFVFEKVGNGQIRIRTADVPTVYYWSADSATFRNPQVMANKTIPGSCETFNVYRCTKVYDGYCYPSVSDRVWGVVFQDSNIVNSQLISTKSATLDQTCAAYCHAQPGCTAWARQPSASSNNCWLTKKGTGYRAASDRNAGPGANFWVGYLWDTRTAIATYKGSVLNSITTDNACSNRCSMNSACVAWSRDTSSNTCRLYRSVGDTFADSSSTCGVRTLPVAPKFNINDNSLETGTYVNIQGANGLYWMVDLQSSNGVVQLTELLNPYDSQQQFKVEQLANGKVMLQSRSTQLWLSYNKATYTARFTAKYPGDSETWSYLRTTIYGSNKEQVQLKSNDGLRWLSLSDSPNNDLGSCTSKSGYPDTCSSVAALTSENAGHLETFNILTPPDPLVRLQPDNSLQVNEYYQIQASNGYWWQVEDTSGIVKLMPGANPSDSGRWFLINNWDAGHVQIQSRKTGLWLRAENNGGNNARFIAVNPSSWETFKYEQLTSGKMQQVRLKTNGGVYWITLAYSFLNDVDSCSNQVSVDRCTSINAMKNGDPGDWETFNVYSYSAIVGNNIGSWFVLEQWMNSDIFVDGDWKGVQFKTGSAVDEWTWSEKQVAFQGRTSAAAARAHHWDNFLVDREFAWMAAHNINTVRIPVGYWLTLSEQELLSEGFPFLPGGVTRLDRAFEVAASYGIWVVISMHGAYGSQNGNDHSGHSGSVGFHLADNPSKTANFVKVLATRYANRPNFYGIGVINEPYIWDGYIPVTTLRDYLALSAGYLRAAAPYAIAFMPDAFHISSVSDFLPPFTGTQFLEAHPYRAFDGDFPGSLEEQMNRIRNDIYNLENAGKTTNYWTFVGECSNGAVYSVFEGMSDSERYYARQLYGITQSAGYAKKTLNMGYTFWTHKVTGGNYNWADWSLRQSMEDQTWPDFYVRT